MANIATPPKLQFFAADGTPLAGGKLYSYAAGTTTPLATYTSSNGVTANPNPITLDSRGEANVWFGAAQYKLVLKTAGTPEVEIWSIDNLNGVDAQTYNAVLTAFAASNGSSLVGYIGGGGSAVASTVQATLQNYVHVEQYGAVGNNITDDYAAILAAANEAVAQGAQLIFDGTKTYKINQDTLTFPAGSNVQFNGATLNFTKTQGSSTNPMIVISGPFSADWIRTTVPTGVVRNYGIIASGNDVAIRQITLTSTDQQAQLGSGATDYAVKFVNGARFQIGKISVTKFDRAVVVDTATDSKIGGCDVTSYVRAVYTLNCTNLYIGASNIQTRSVNASNLPGHNGLLSEIGTNNTFEDFTVNDAAEEGIRFGQGPHRNVMLVRPRVRNAQANGVKVLSTNNATPVAGEYAQALFIIDAIVEDCGTSGGSDDRNGILIQRVVGCQITNPIIRKRSATYSAVYGILVSGSTDVLITNPLIQDTQFAGIYLAGTVGTSAIAADISSVNVIGGMISNANTSGLRIVSTGATLRQIYITGVKLFNNNTLGAAISGTGTFVDCYLNASFYNNTETTISCNSTSWMMDCYGNEAYGTIPTSFASISAQNSSRWSNLTSFYVRKAGTWTAL